MSVSPAEARPSATIEPHIFTDATEAKAITADTLAAVGFTVVSDPALIDKMRFRTYTAGKRSERRPSEYTEIAATLNNPSTGVEIDLGIGLNRHSISRDTYDWRGVITRHDTEGEQILFDNGNHDSNQSEFATNIASLLMMAEFGVEIGYSPADRSAYEAWKADMKVQLAPIAGRENPYLG